MRIKQLRQAFIGLGLSLLCTLALALPTADSLEVLRVQWEAAPAEVTAHLEREVHRVEEPGSAQPTRAVLARLYWMHGQAQLLQRHDCDEAAKAVTKADALGLRRLWPKRYDTPFVQMQEQLARCLPAERREPLSQQALDELAGPTRGQPATPDSTWAQVAQEALGALAAPAHPFNERGPQSAVQRLAGSVAVPLSAVVAPEWVSQALFNRSLEALAQDAPWLVLVLLALTVSVLRGMLRIGAALMRLAHESRESAAVAVSRSPIQRRMAAAAAKRHRAPRRSGIERLRPWD